MPRGRSKGNKNKSKLHPSDRPELLEMQIELNQLENKKELVGEPYKVQLKSLGRVFKSEGKTLEEALGRIKISGGVKVTSVLTVEKDGVKKEKLLRGSHAARLFTPMGPTNREIALKWVHQSFGI